MQVYLYSGMQKLIEKSGVGRAIYHQRMAAKENAIGIVNRMEEADVVHINTVFPYSFLLAKRAHKKGIPVVYHAHSTKEDFENSYIGANLLSSLFKIWITCCYNQGDMIITPTPYSKRLLRSYGIKKPIQAISNGIDLDFFSKENADGDSFRKKYGYKKEDKIIVSVGLPIDRKGILDFVELAKRMPDYQFIWFGSTQMNLVSKEIQNAISNPLSNIQFAGYVNKEMLRNAYAGCDLFLFPSKEETEGIVVLEALAMKIPVLIRDIPVYDDWLEDGKHVYKAKDIDEFEENALSILEGTKPSLIENGYTVVQQRDIKEVGSQLGRIYKYCIKIA